MISAERLKAGQSQFLSFGPGPFASPGHFFALPEKSNITSIAHFRFPQSQTTCKRGPSRGVGGSIRLYHDRPPNTAAAARQNPNSHLLPPASHRRTPPSSDVPNRCGGLSPHGTGIRPPESRSEAPYQTPAHHPLCNSHTHGRRPLPLATLSPLHNHLTSFQRHAPLPDSFVRRRTCPQQIHARPSLLSRRHGPSQAGRSTTTFCRFDPAAHPFLFTSGPRSPCRTRFVYRLFIPNRVLVPLTHPFLGTSLGLIPAPSGTAGTGFWFPLRSTPKIPRPPAATPGFAMLTSAWERPPLTLLVPERTGDKGQLRP